MSHQSFYKKIRFVSSEYRPLRLLIVPVLSFNSLRFNRAKESSEPELVEFTSDTLLCYNYM